MKQIEINGLLWDTENLKIDGKKYFTWQEAIAAAKSVGKRLPTKEEYEALIASGYEFDKENQGMWFAGKKLFFPLSGYLNSSSGDLQYATNGYYWASSPRDASYSWRLSFLGSSTSVGNSNAKFGFPVRCVQDKSDNVIIEKETSLPSKDIDWEQRRYEIAKDILCSIVTGNIVEKDSVQNAIMYADKLIEQLRK